MSNADTNTSQSTDGPMSGITSLSNLTDELTKLAALHTQVRIVENQVMAEVWELLLSGQDTLTVRSLKRLALSMIGSMESMENSRLSLTAITKQLNALGESSNKSTGAE